MLSLVFYALSFLLGLGLTVFAVAVGVLAVSPVVSAKPYLYSFGGGILAGIAILAAVAVYVHNHSF